MANWKQVVDLHARKPWLTNAEAAEIIGCHIEYVRSTCRRRGIRFSYLRREHRYRSAWDQVRWLLEQTEGGSLTLTLDEDRCVVAKLEHGSGYGKLYRAWRPEDTVIELSKCIKAGQ